MQIIATIPRTDYIFINNNCRVNPILLEKPERFFSSLANAKFLLSITRFFGPEASPNPLGIGVVLRGAVALPAV